MIGVHHKQQFYFVKDSHTTWTDMWNLKYVAGNYITDVYWNAAHKAQPLVYFQNQHPVSEN